MREIKFRAWDGIRMIMPDSGAYYQHYLSFCGEITQRCSEGMACFCGEDRWRAVRDLRLMQYTGLKDANGVEIYEGDIVHWGHIKGYEECMPRKAVVEFSPDLTFSTFNLESNHKFRFGGFAYRNTEKAVEVIGNIYQNPELLK